MRITDGMVTEASRSSLRKPREAAFEANRVAATGMRVERPGDDASAAARARRLNEDGARITAAMRSADEANRGLDVVDGALGDMSEMLSQARVLAIQAANGTIGPAERASLADQIAGLRSTVLQATAARVDGRYVLNGLREDAPPYDAAGTFVGDRNRRSVEASIGHFVESGLAIGEVLSPAGGTDAFTELTALETAIRTGNAAGMQTGIDAMRDIHSRVADARAEVGGRMSAFDMALSLGEKLAARTKADASAAVEADMFDALSELTRAQTALEQAVALASRLPLPGLAQR